jgi:hypothetical protein
VRNWFKNLLSKCNLHRYIPGDRLNYVGLVVVLGIVHQVGAAPVGIQLAHSLKAPGFKP